MTGGRNDLDAHPRGHDRVAVTQWFTLAAVFGKNGAHGGTGELAQSVDAVLGSVLQQTRVPL